MAMISLMVSEALGLAPGDKIRISVVEQPDLEAVYMVSGGGYIDFPMIGRVQVGGLNTQEVAALIKQQLEEDFFYMATVLAEVEEYQEGEIFVMGEVQTPGPISLQQGQSISVTEAIAMRGGFTPSASANEVRVLRYVAGESEPRRESIRVPVQDVMNNFEVEKDVYLVPRDMVVVPAIGQTRAGGGEVLILGAVRSPRYVPLSPQMDLVRALMFAGGWTEYANLDQIRVLRSIPESEYDEWIQQHPESKEQTSSFFEGMSSMEKLEAQYGPLAAEAVLEGSAEGSGMDETGLDTENVSSDTAAAAAAAEDAAAEESVAPAPATGEESPGETVAEPMRKVSMSVDLNSLLAEGAVQQNISLQAGDIIYVPGGQVAATMGIVYVLGPGVLRGGPQEIPMSQKYTVGLAVTRAGVGRFANLAKTVLKRRDPETGEMDEIQINLDRILNKGEVEDDVPVQDGDVIFVYEKLIGF
jgi:protein involved in polysaccharide export with SLBB domain